MFPSTGTVGAAALVRQLGSWKPDGPRPAYLALAEALRLLVLDGRVPVGTALPSERALAAHLAATLIPGTLTRSGTQFVLFSPDGQDAARTYAELAEVAGAVAFVRALPLEPSVAERLSAVAATVS